MAFTQKMGGGVMSKTLPLFFEEMVQVFTKKAHPFYIHGIEFSQKTHSFFMKKKHTRLAQMVRFLSKNAAVL